MTINNREQIIEQLAELLKQFDKDGNDYQTDVYMYVDDQGNGMLDTFVNVGGNSWLDDDHYTVYSDKAHYEAYNGYYDNDTTESLAELLGISKDKLIEETKNHLIDDLGYDEEDTEEADFYDVWRWLTSNNYCPNDYEEKLQADYEARIEECSADYLERAEEIFEQFEESTVLL